MYDFQVPIWAKQILVSLYFLALIQCAYYALVAAYEIRLYAINEYGRVIHEFDPYFNYRAAEYLWANGWKRFREWFDYMSWYPLGRPVGTTMYPGMQITSCFIKKYILPNWSINDICVFVPAWFGVLATSSTALLAYECTVGLVGSSKEKKNSGIGVGEPFGSILSNIPIVNVVYEKLVVPLVHFLLDLLQTLTGSTWGLRVATKIESRTTALSTPALECALFTAAIMSIVPAHLLRSVGGGYDNESVATFAMTLTFYCWARSLRGNTTQLETIVWGLCTGVAYFYMVMAWGGYVFVLNLIGVHAGFLVLLGRYSTKLHRAYSVFYVVGTILAIQVPVVGLTPIKSLEQLGAFVAFGGLQLIEVCEVIRRQRKLSTVDAWKLRAAVFGGAAVAAAGLAAILAPTGYFGPVSARVRGLFVKHTKTGNPLVDSVAEHQAASKAAYFQYLNHVSNLAPVGFGMVALFFFHDASSFLIVYGFAAYFFSHRMVRLILLTAPIASVLGGIVLGHGWAWFVSGILNDDRDNLPSVPLLLGATQTPTSSQEAPPKSSTKKKDGKPNNGNKKSADAGKGNESKETLWKLWTTWRLPLVLLVRVAVSVLVIRRGIKYAKEFQNVAHDMAHAISHPTIIAKARTQQGEEVMVDDYREAYWWLRDHTAEDARIMAWWDYGYQITGISNRTTLADGNTWNHEHIALLGRTLTATEKEAHRIARHLADYVLVWAGGGGDDLAKSPHLRRIANSVYRHICPGDPTCRSFGIMHDGTPTPEMEESLLYKLVANGLRQDVSIDPNRFREVFISKYGKVRIYKIQSVSRQSKEWVLKNRVCDVPGGWFCRGQYPPALRKILKEKKDFKQLEDFNVKGDDSEYNRQYMENLNNPDKAARQQQQKRQARKNEPPKRLSDVRIEELNEVWVNNDATTIMWELISSGRLSDFRDALSQKPELAHVRSEDGRGPMWWAHEYGQKDMIELLKKMGVTEDREDANGMTPLSLSKK